MSQAREAPRWITTISVKNWKNFTNASARLAQRTFVVGPNAVGKSNFLDLLRFLRDIVSIGGGFQEAVRRRGGVSAIRCLAARQDPTIEIRIKLSADVEAKEWEYVLEFGQDNQRKPVLRQEVTRYCTEELLRRPDKHD